MEDDLESQDLKDESEKRGKDDIERRNTEDDPERRDNTEDDLGRREDTEEDSGGRAEEDESKLQKGKVEPAEKDLDSSEEAEEAESKGRRKKKKFSLVTYFVGESSKQDYETDDEQESIKSSGSLQKKLLALEEQLSVESIHKTTSKIYHPNEGLENSDSKDKPVESKTKSKRVYMSSTMTAVFIISAATGSTLTKLPYHLKESGWFGVYLILLLGLNTLYAGLCVGWCWKVMEEIWPEHMEYTRTPYQDLAQRAVGKWMSYVVVFLIDLSILGYCSNYILLFSETLNLVVTPHHKNCYLMIITVVVIYPFAFFGSYRDIKFVGISDISLSIAFTFLVILCFFFDEWTSEQFKYSSRTAESIALAFAGMSFGYGTGAVLPSIMIDMADRSKFTEACATATILILAMYTILPILGYAAYGDTTPLHILDHLMASKSMRIFGIIIDFIQAFQLIASCILSLIPVFHSFEVLAKCRDEFCARRVIVRTAVMVFLALLTLGMPYLSVYMDLLGATSINLLTFIFPPIFYLLLRRKQKNRFSKRKSTVKESILVAEIIILGLVILVAASYALLKQFHSLVPGRLSCFYNMTRPPIPETRKEIWTH